jgi:hypothetical protein
VLAKSQSTSPTGAQTGEASASGIGVLTRPKTAAEVAWEQQKEAAAKAWMQQTNGGTLVQSHNGVQPAGVIQPDCVIDPNTGQCASITVVSISGGGEYTAEPTDEPNWCGPGAGTTAMMHWNYTAVVNHGSETVPNNANTGYETYSGAQGYMAWLAANIYIPVDGRYGVSQIPYSNSTLIGVLKDGINVATGTSYYIVHTSSSVSDMMANVQYDIGHDNHPMIYLVSAKLLPDWNTTATVYHYVQGYAYGFYPGGTDSTNQVYYAETLTHAAEQQVISAGDWSTSNSQMWAAVSATPWSDFIV